MSKTKTKEEISILKEGGKRLSSILYEVESRVKPGVLAEDLNQFAVKLIENEGGTPSFLGFKVSGIGLAYPAALCVCLNDEIVHGIPGSKVLENGDIVGLDLGMKYKGLYTDMAFTVGVGEISEKAKKLINTTKESLDMGINAIREGANIGDIGAAIQRHVESNGFSVVRVLVGHGVGYSVHEDPEIPNYEIKGKGVELKEGMVLALEPMVNEGSHEVILDPDGWTYKTADGSLSAHFEHTVAVTKNGSEILTFLS